MQFFEQILPTEGFYCVATLYPSGAFRNFFYPTLREALDKIAYFDMQGETVYFGQASYKTTESRKGENTLFLRSFFLDIDCGPEKDYPSQQEAVAALKQMVVDLSLPEPTIVVSGNGLYAYWPIVEDMPTQQWRSIARILKKTLSAYGFKYDTSRTADAASVLRPVGSTHRKDKANPKPVKLVRGSASTPFSEFVGALNKAAKKFSVDLTATQPPKANTDINAEFMNDDRRPSFAADIAENCAQMRRFRDSQGNVSEPYWYSALGVLVFCEDSWDTIQEWSSGHAEYDPKVTAAKAQQYLDSGVGPSTCVQFDTVNNGGCVGCPHASKIKSPIVLGRPAPVAIPLEDPTEVDLTPEGYRRAEGGLYYEEEGRWMRFYDRDLRVERLAFDETLGYQTAVISHDLPYEGRLEFAIRSSLIHDPKAFMVALSDNNVHVIGTKERKAMIGYAEGWMATLTRNQQMARLMSQMGWNLENPSAPRFVLGKRIVYSDGHVETASLARNVPEAAASIDKAGTLEAWVDATKVLAKPGMEQFAFALLCGFGAPLMKFTGYDGAMVSLVGPTGIGKTLMLSWMLSIYGFHKDLIMGKEDTRNALVSRLGVYGNLPMGIDEVTNIDGQELSDLAYRITQGRDKARLTKSAEERKNLNKWNTIAVVSTNSSLVERLSSTKSDASAEINRIFEYNVKPVNGFSGPVATEAYWTFHKNYGHAGEKYVQYLTQNYDQIEPNLQIVQDKVRLMAGIKGEERFWAAVVSTAIYGGLVAKKLGLIQFDVTPVLAWAVDQVSDLREAKGEAVDDPVAVLAQFVDRYSANRLIVRGNPMGGKEVLIVEAPRGALYMRQELDTNRLYISRSVFRNDVSKGYGSYNDVRMHLQNIGALKHANKNKTLGAGTQFAGASQPCLEIDLTCPALGTVVAKLVETAEEPDKVRTISGARK